MQCKFSEISDFPWKSHDKLDFFMKITIRNRPRCKSTLKTHSFFFFPIQIGYIRRRSSLPTTSSSPTTRLVWCPSSWPQPKQQQQQQQSRIHLLNLPATPYILSARPPLMHLEIRARSFPSCIMITANSSKLESLHFEAFFGYPFIIYTYSRTNEWYNQKESRLMESIQMQKKLINDFYRTTQMALYTLFCYSFWLIRKLKNIY